MESEGKPEEMNTAIKKRAELKRLRNSIGKALKQADVLDSVRLLTNELEILEGIL
jgi:hypothetical protein